MNGRPWAREDDDLLRRIYYGATFREAAGALKIDPAEASRRLSDLHGDGLVARLAMTRQSARGAAAHVYVLPAYQFARELASNGENVT